MAAPLLGAASCETDPVKLAPIPPPAPIVVRVPTYVPLPVDATTPCAKPQPRPVLTDVDLLRLADAFRVQAMCNANKLAAIQSAQPKGPLP